MPRPAQGGPNPLFTRWLQEWRDQAAERGRPRSQRAYERALSSLHKYPLPLQSGREARILQYFGEQICRQLDQQLERHRRAQDAPEPVISSPGGQEEGDTPNHLPLLLPGQSCPEPQPAQRRHAEEKQPVAGRRARGYRPAPRSGAYALLAALYQDSVSPHSRGYLTKPELQRAAQPLCDKSFFLVEAGSKSTAWSSVSTLIRKELVLKTNIPARYSLTEAGLALAQKLIASKAPVPLQETHPSPPVAVAAGTGESPPLSEEDEGASGSQTFPEPNCGGPRARLPEPQFILRPGEFDVVLCVDFIETTGGPTTRKQELVDELHRNFVPFSIRKLHVGDFLWVAREKVSPAAGQQQQQQQKPPAAARELVLDYVVERKRMPDLCGSIIDGRFHEQKFRLRQCGLLHPIYLVEDPGAVQHLSLPEKTLQQAMTNTQVVDGFFVKRTRDLRESAAYLTLMTRQLAQLYGDKTLLGCSKEELEHQRPLQASHGSCRLLTFAEFNEGAVKNKAQTVSEVFARQLMQVSGVSGEKAAAILERYKTPASLLAAYSACPTPEGRDRLLSSIKCGKLQR
ncbi:hypothetical protein lerEdw1_007359 [Lerista edwardsae]|nr:hypothetical protein lerEdw1_007359 [Lerista edwardsae]